MGSSYVYVLRLPAWCRRGWAYGFLGLMGVACTNSPSGTPTPGDSGLDAHGDAIPSGDTLTPGDDNLSPYLAASAYCETIAPFFCDFYVRCGRMAVDSHQACLSLTAESCEGRYEPMYVELEQAGLLRLSRSGLEACEEHLNTVTCAHQPRELQGPCAGVWEGQQSHGEPCGFNLESFACAPGLTCVLGPDLCGECRTQLEPGATCPADGATCAPGGDCEEGVCVARRTIGQSCTPEQRCELGAWCDEGTCVGPNVSSLGQPCDRANRCPYGSECTQGTCQPTARLGAACESTSCETGWCNANDLCIPLLDTGASCTSNTSCRTGQCDKGRCVGLPSTCIAP